MAYSDYGGYGYKNGVRVEERSDAVITEQAQSVPGMYPGFAFAMQGVEEPAKLVHENPNGHVVMGDAPLYVGLYKQTTVSAWVDGQKLDLDKLAVNLPEEYFGEYGINHDRITDESGFGFDDPIEFRLPGATLFVRWTNEDNYYQYARLEQGDDVWTGWSGYGVGAGLENCGYGFSTVEREMTLLSFWPDAIKESP